CPVELTPTPFKLSCSTPTTGPNDVSCSSSVAPWRTFVGAEAAPAALLRCNVTIPSLTFKLPEKVLSPERMSRPGPPLLIEVAATMLPPIVAFIPESTNTEPLLRLIDSTLIALAPEPTKSKMPDVTFSSTSFPVIVTPGPIISELICLDDVNVYVPG